MNNLGLTMTLATVKQDATLMFQGYQLASCNQDVAPCAIDIDLSNCEMIGFSAILCTLDRNPSNVMAMSWRIAEEMRNRCPDAREDAAFAIMVQCLERDYRLSIERLKKLSR